MLQILFNVSPEISAIESTSHGADQFLSTPTTTAVEMGMYV